MEALPVILGAALAGVGVAVTANVGPVGLVFTAAGLVLILIGIHRLRQQR
jgi:uncharacterized membrane protein